MTIGNIECLLLGFCLGAIAVALIALPEMRGPQRRRGLLTTYPKHRRSM